MNRLHDSARDLRAPSRVGRDARLEVEFERRGRCTAITHAYAEPPFRIGHAFELGDAAYLIIVCSGPGLFAGDALRQSITVGSGARVVLTSQSALQIHPSLSPAPATIHHRYRLHADGELHCHWDPIIPFRGARLLQRFELRADEGARLSWSDALMSGRVSRGERWQFDTVQHELRLDIAGAVRYLERYRVSPGERMPDRQWVAGQANYFATTLVHHERAGGEAVDVLRRELETADSVRSGVDLIDSRLLVARLLAERGAPFASARTLCRRAVLNGLFESPHLAGRKSV